MSGSESAEVVAVVGGGISGAACAARLAEAGLSVLLLDRSRRLGGRMASTHLRGTGTAFDGRIVDQGASYLTAHDERFRVVVDDWLDRGLARGWTDTFHVAGPDGLRGTTTGPLRYATPTGLQSLVEDLVGRLPASVSTRFPVDVAGVSLGPEGRPRVDGQDVQAVALCMPDPQARRLLDPRQPALRSTRLATEGVLWEPVLALTAVFAERCWPQLDGVFVHDDPVITWIADDGRRRGDDAPVLVVHADPVFSAAYLGEPQAATAEMLASLRRVLDLSCAPAWARVHRWAYARPVTAWPEPYHLDPGTRVGLAGDGWHAGPRIECAWLSGDALGAALAASLR